MLSRHTIAASVFVLVAGVAGCVAEQGADYSAVVDDEVVGKDAVQMNDVSVLLPLPKAASELNAYVAASSKGKGGAFVPEDVYRSATPFEEPEDDLHPGQDVEMHYGSLRAVAFRLDPCFANVGPVVDASKCKNQLRIVFQSLRFWKGATSGDAIDGALHAFYSLTREELTQAVRDMIALRIANGGTKDLGPLAVHPIVSRQGMTGAMAKGIGALLAKYAGAKNLTRFTRFTSGNLQTVWHFSGFDVKGKGTSFMSIPTLPNGTVDGSFFGGFGGGLDGEFTPSTTSKDDISILVKVESAKAASPAARQAAFDASLRIDNPDFHSPDTIDCASCHLAQQGREMTGEKELKLSARGNKNAFVPNAKWVPAKDFAQTTPLAKQSNGLNVHAFSYKFDSPMINQRTINETAGVVAYSNTVLLAKPK